MLVGQYDYAIDAKGRLNFPARFRDVMGETFIVTRWLDHCLAAFPAEEFEKVAAKIEGKGLVKGRKVSRMLYASAVEVTPDKQGRSSPPNCGSTRVLTTMSPLSAAAALPRFGTPRLGMPARKPAMRTSPLRWKTLTFNKQDDTTWNFHISPYCCSPAWMG